jgi:hypothetical protein
MTENDVEFCYVMVQSMVYGSMGGVVANCTLFQVSSKQGMAPLFFCWF